MTQAEAKRAIDEGCAESLKHAFGVLITNIITTSEADAIRKFATDIELHHRAHGAAIAVVEKVFLGE